MFQQKNREAWPIFFIVAILVHVAIVFGLIGAEKLLNQPKKMPVIYTVKIFETLDAPKKPALPKATPKPEAKPEVKPKPKLKPKVKSEPVVKETKPKEVPKPKPKPKPQPKPKPKVAKPKAEPKKTKVVKEIKKDVPKKPVQPKAEQKKVSLKPKKDVKAKKEIKKSVKKIKKKKKTQKASRKNSEQQAEKKLEQRIAALKKRVAEKKEEEHLQKRLAELASKRSEGQKDTIDESLRIYFAKVWSKIRANWRFPKALLQDKEPMCVIVVRIAKDGSLEKAWFEKRSELAAFNVFAMKAVREAAPFEPIPNIIGQSSLEIGVRFKPGSVGE